MIKKTASVKSKKDVVGTAEYLVFDSVAEAVGELSEPKVLSLINAQYRTNAMNVVRSGATGKPSKTYLRNLAWTRVSPDEFESVAGDYDALQALVERKMAEVEKEIMASRPEVETAEEDEDDDEDQ